MQYFLKMRITVHKKDQMLVTIYFNIIIILMQTKESKGIDIQQLRLYNTQRIVQNDFRAIPLNVKLASNPFLKDQQKYHYLIYKLNDFNKKVLNSEIADQYEAMYYQRLHSALCDISFIDTKADQITSLDEVFKWAKEQEKLVEQRRDQGYVRYQVTKQVRNGVQPEKKDRAVSQKSHADQIPSQAIARSMLPFKKGWRTTHKQLDIPARRLQQYKRKILNIAPFIEPKQQKKPPRVTYPKIPKVQYKEEEPEQNQPPADGAVPPADGQLKQGQQKQGEDAANAADQQQDLGGFGQQPQQPQQQEPVQVEGEDKLAPKLKSYTLQYEDIKRKEYKGPYMFYRGEEYEIQRKMEEKYLKIHQDQLKKQKQDKQAIQIMDQWAARKAKMDKQHQKRLESGVFSAKFSFSTEEPSKAEMLSAIDELKFGFTENLRRSKMPEIQLSSSYLPRIGQQNLYQKSIRKDRLKSLKNKFGKLLNLQQYEDREASQSLCQYTSRKRELSEIIRNHSKSKQRLNQLDEVTRIKQKLARNKVGIDIRSLSMGLCVPQQQSNPPGSIFPDKALPSNPDLIETKKKKKKK